jgi:hypothetical protein
VECEVKGKSYYPKFATHQYCIVVSPAPTLHSDSKMDSHKGGYSFAKQSIVANLKTELTDNDLGRRGMLSGALCTILDEDTLAECIDECAYLVYIGSGVGYELGSVEESSPQQLISSCGDLPKIVVICLKYGASTFAKGIVNFEKNASNIVYAIWIDVDPNEDCGLIVGVLDHIADGVKSIDMLSKDLSQLLRKKGKGVNHGVILGRAYHDNISLGSIRKIGSGVVKVVGESSAPINNVFSSLSPPQPSLPMYQFKSESLGLAAVDMELFSQMLDECIDNNAKNHIMCLGYDVSDRHRTIMFEIVKKYLSVSKLSARSTFGAVLVIDDESSLASFSEKEASQIFGKSNKVLILLWCDLPHCSPEIADMIRSISLLDNILVLLTFKSLNEHLKFKDFEKSLGLNVNPYQVDEIEGQMLHSICSNVYEEIYLDIALPVQLTPSLFASYDKLKLLSESLQKVITQEFRLLVRIQMKLLTLVT